MNIVFMGTSSFAVPSLKRMIAADLNLVGIVSQPDRPKGRGKKIIPTPVKEAAAAYDIPVFQPQSIKDTQAIANIQAWEPDLIVVISYGQILPKALLDFPRLGCINVHASLLPRYRGAAPIQRALMDGKKRTGVTTMFMEEGLDTGDIIMQVPVEIDTEINHGQLEAVLAEKGADLLLDTIAVMESGSIPRRKQDNLKATYAAMLTREDEHIDWKQSAISIHNRVRALSPQPGAYTIIKGTKVKIYKTRVIEEKTKGEAGMVISISKEGFVVQTGEGLLEMLEVQKEGKKRLPASDFLKGFKLETGVILGS